MNQFAQQIYVNGRIATQDPSKPLVNSMAVGHGKILSVNTDEVKRITNNDTQVIDLQGYFVLPGLIDCHVHALWGAKQDVFECFVGYEADLQQLAHGVAHRVKTLSAGEWLTGGPWNLGHIATIKQQGLTPRQWLDAISPVHPVCLYDTTKHSMLVNSVALETAHIAAQIPNFESGLIELDEHGALSGLLHEEASGAVRKFVTYTPEQMLRAGQYMVNRLHSYGITAIKEAMAFASELSTYQQLDKQGALNLHVFSHIARSSPLHPDAISLDDMRELQGKYRSTNHHPDGCKLFLDGVAPSRTAAFFDPYVPCCCVSEAADKYDADQLLRISPKELGEQIAELDQAGFTVKMHAVGDRAVNAGLDGIAVARNKATSGLLHEIAHTSFVTDSDFVRFKQLGAVAEVSPKIWFPTAITAAQIQMLGEERTNRCHPIKTLLDNDALVTYGSDWPAAVPDADPWIGMAGMITREHPKGLYPGHVGYEQGIGLQQALTIFTGNGAKAMRMSDQIGQLKPGYQADFIVLNQHIDKIHPNAIADTQVLATYFAGNCVYTKES
jgi:predicted amidohydrolase YtcJ